MHSKNSKGENDLARSIDKPRVMSGILLFMNDFLLENSYRIETHIDMVV